MFIGVSINLKFCMGKHLAQLGLFFDYIPYFRDDWWEFVEEKFWGADGDYFCHNYIFYFIFEIISFNFSVVSFSS